MVYAGSEFQYPVRFRSSKEGLDQIMQNWVGSDMDGLARFWPNTSGAEVSRCARIIRPGSGRT